MTSFQGKIVADFETQLALKISVGGTTGTLASATDDDGVALPSGRYFFTLDKGNSKKEHISCDLSGTSMTNIKSVSRQGVETSGVLREHKVGANVIISDFAHIKKINDLLDGTTNLNASSPLAYDATATITSDNQLATRGYVLGVVTGGTVTYNIQTITATAGETIVAGNICYFKESDQRWWKADADLTATIDNVQLSVAQGSATAGVNTTFALSGLVPSFTGLTAGSKYYLSNTAGNVSTTAGTNSLLLGTATNTTTLLFSPSKTYNNPSNFVSISTGTSDASKGVKLNSSGRLDAGLFLADSSGTDGALNVTSGTTTLNDASKIVGDFAIYNYTTFNISIGATLTVGSNLQNKILVLKHNSGDAVVAGTINLSGFGGAGGVAAAVGSLGARTQLGLGKLPTGTNFITGATASEACNNNFYDISNGSGGAGGKSGQSYAGGAGGAGGMSLIIVSTGIINITGTINLSGANGSNAANETYFNTMTGGGSGGAGGGSGNLLLLANTFSVASATFTLNGGTAGSSSGAVGVMGGQFSAQWSPGGSSGGSSGRNQSAAGANGTASSVGTGGASSAGAIGSKYFMIKDTYNNIGI